MKLLHNHSTFLKMYIVTISSSTTIFVNVVMVILDSSSCERLKKNVDSEGCRLVGVKDKGRWAVLVITFEPEPIWTYFHMFGDNKQALTKPIHAHSVKIYFAPQI